MADTTTMGVRQFGRWNLLGTRTLAEREIRRFMAVWAQTLAAPLITAGLLLSVFALAIGPARGDVMGVPFIHFLAPGILMMTVIQNAFANTSSSIISAKVQGNIVDTLMPPLSAVELVIGYVAGGVARGLVVAGVIALTLVLFMGMSFAHPFVAFYFVLIGSAFMAGLGIVAATFARKFDQLSAISNFVITPLSFLSGTFYSIDRLPGWLQVMSHVNPVFYLIDGMRYATIGASDSSPLLGAVVCTVVTAGILTLNWYWFRLGYRLKA